MVTGLPLIFMQITRVGAVLSLKLEWNRVTERGIQINYCTLNSTTNQLQAQYKYTCLKNVCSLPEAGLSSVARLRSGGFCRPNILST